MKRFLLLTSVLICATVLAVAQHPTFMGVSMNQSASNIANQLASRNGWTIVDSDEDTYELMGTYLDIPNCDIFIFNNNQVNRCYAISVYFPEQSTWNTLKNRYRDVVRKVKAQASDYTTTDESSEFIAPYAEGDGDEMLAVTAEKCNYRTVMWRGDNAKILIYIHKKKKVLIHFYDFDNYPSDDDDQHTTTTTGSEGCMHFLNIPMNISASAFSQQLVNNHGFEQTKYNPNSHCYSHRGRFSGHNNAEVYVFGTNVSEHVYEIDAYLPEQTTWAGIKAQYLTYRDALKQKYTLTDETTGFTDGLSEGSGKEVQWVKDKKCNYTAEFSAPG
ncbi:MAG: hypothetical protein ACI4AM_01360, partial [Muribaculaceae bacterium]